MMLSVTFAFWGVGQPGDQFMRRRRLHQPRLPRRRDRPQRRPRCCSP
jgi:hypothetical protein